MEDTIVAEDTPSQEIPPTTASLESIPKSTHTPDIGGKSSKKRKRKEKDEEAKTDDIENRYLTKVYSRVSEKETPQAVIPEYRVQAVRPVQASRDPEQEAEEDEIDPDLLQHETLTRNSTSADKTLFISNLPVKVLTSKPHLREMKQLFSAHGQILSIRFRSIAFSELGPRRVAFITKKLHPDRDTLNAYIVYENASSVDDAVKALNGSLWQGKHLRVDSVSNPAVIPSSISADIVS